MPAKNTAPAPKKPTSLAALRDDLTRRYGDRVVKRETVTPYQVIPTGSLTLDLATRVGGWVCGRMVEIVGPEGVGKTTTVISSMIEAQRMFPDKAVAYIDMEQTFDYGWAERLGLLTDSGHWLHLYPDDSEDVADMLRRTVETGFCSLVSIDSIGGMESKEAFTKAAADKVMGRNAQVITRMVKHCAVLTRATKTVVLLVNQYRANLDNPQSADISAGPKAMKYSTTMRVDMSQVWSADPLKALLPGDDEETVVGRMIRARITRNKVAVQGKRAEFYLVNADTPEHGPIGIDRADEAVTVGLFTEVIERRGNWYYLPLQKGQKKPTGAQGRPALTAHLRSCPDDLEAVRNASLAVFSHEVKPEVTVEAEMVATG
jgi:recombination protein RecA